MKVFFQLFIGVIIFCSLSACYSAPVQQEPFLNDRKIQSIKANAGGSMNSLDREREAAARRAE